MLQTNFKRIVIKIGSSLLYSAENKPDIDFVGNLTNQISHLVKNKTEITLVSSGAIALGMSLLELESRPKELCFLQACAAIGQNELMDIYRKSFRSKDLFCGQILLTWEDFDERRRYLNARNTLLALLKLGVIPVINENDSVSTEEIKFGDNDRLSALVSSLISADLLIILSDVDGLYDRNKKTLVRLIDEITPQIKALACPTDKKTCVGGMITKIKAAEIAVDSGIPCVIANGRQTDILLSVIKQPEGYGSLFIPKKHYLAAKKRWIAFGTRPKGRIVVDDGAKKALINKKSLLSVGIVGCAGNFDHGDVVRIVDQQDCEFARGKAGLSSKQLEKVKGSHFDKEIIHCDNIVVL
ncbi:MAG: glutamate 5-kinase [Candidatus Omnitrophota bacterium]